MGDPPTKKGLTITVSGWAGVGKGTVGDALAQDMGLRLVVMGDMFREIARERHMGLEELSTTREDEIDYRIDRRALQLAMEGEVVLDGRLTAIAAGEFADCNVFVQCDTDQKSVRVAEREHVSTYEARKNLEQRDANDSARYIKLYGSDGSQGDLYDVVIDTTHMDIPTTRAEAIKAVRRILAQKHRL